MKIVIVNIAREEGGFCYNLMRIIKNETDLDRMQLEYPFPLEVLSLEDDITAEEIEAKFHGVRVEGKEDWYYTRSFKLWLKKRRGGVE